MKKVLIFLLICLGIAGVCVITCPDKQAHKDALMSVINAKLNSEMRKESDDDAIVMFGSALGSRIIEVVIDNRLEVENKFVFSLGIIQKDNGPETVSLGILGHVFTISKEEFNKAFDEATSEMK